MQRLGLALVACVALALGGCGDAPRTNSDARETGSQFSVRWEGDFAIVTDHMNDCDYIGTNTSRGLRLVPRLNRYGQPMCGAAR